MERDVDGRSPVSVGREWDQKANTGPSQSGRQRDDIIGPALHEPLALVEGFSTPVRSLRPAAGQMGKSGLANGRGSVIDLDSPDTESRAEPVSDNRAVLESRKSSLRSQ